MDFFFRFLCFHFEMRNYKVKDFRQARVSVVDSSKVTIKKKSTRANLALFTEGPFIYYFKITSEKDWVGGFKKMAISDEVQYYCIYAGWVDPKRTKNVLK